MVIRRCLSSYRLKFLVILGAVFGNFPEKPERERRSNRSSRPWMGLKPLSRALRRLNPGSAPVPWVKPGPWNQLNQPFLGWKELFESFAGYFFVWGELPPRERTFLELPERFGEVDSN